LENVKSEMGIQTLSKAVPAGFGRGRRSNTIVLLRADAADWAEIPDHVEQWAPEQGLSPWEQDSGSGFLFGAAQAGYDLLWRSWRTDESPEQVVDSLIGYDAVIVPAPYDENLPAVRMLLDAGVPVVLAYSQMDDPRVCWVACENRLAVTEAVRHLVRLGHTRIGYVGGPRNVMDFRDRERGYVDGMVQGELQINPDWVAATGLDRTEVEIKAAATRVLGGQDRPSAVVCAEDALAIGVMEKAWEMDLRVPEDVAVVGFDDTPEVFELIPHLTSIRQPTVEIANRACYLAACCVAGEQPVFNAWQVELPTTLMIRESCGGARGLYLELGNGPGETNGGHSIRQELEWRMRQLTAMNQEMQDLLYVASHDLRAPLVTIQGFASSLQRKYGDKLDDGGKHYLTRIGCSVDNMRNLIESLLTLSRAHNQPLSEPRACAERDRAGRVRFEGVGHGEGYARPRVLTHAHGAGGRNGALSGVPEPGDQCTQIHGRSAGAVDLCELPGIPDGIRIHGTR
jgi:DNA-binding LacI/PurR family transcriptional regulator